MIAIVWEFLVKPEALPAFESGYGPEGDWAKLFGLHRGYRGTTLLRDTANPCRFLTIDRWDAEEDFSSMRATSTGEYDALDARFEGLTESERKLGIFRD